ncbi:hypothetical protein BGX20_005152 [Mortierella sp. AD010]|nr:hypothetical protein BGX20_005152 [Mortierella sp. AD010]
MEDAAQVFGEALPELIARTKNPTLADPPQFLTDILAPLKEKALNEDGDIDSSRLTSLCHEDPMPRLKDGAKIPKYMGENPGDTFYKNKDIRGNFLYRLHCRGETGVEESKTQKEVNESAHAACPATPRKVDCKLVASVVKSKKWEFKTISTFELKPLQANVQQARFLLFLIGYSAQLRHLGAWIGYVCGKVLDEELVIPTSDPELEWFLDGRCLAVSMSLKAHFLAITQQVQREHARPIQAPEVPRAPLHRPAADNHTFYTPKRARTNSAPTIFMKKRSRQEK